MDRPNPLFRNLNSKIASLPMMLIVMGVFVGGTLWTVLFSFTNIKILPIFTPKQWIDGFVGFANYKPCDYPNRAGWLAAKMHRRHAKHDHLCDLGDHHLNLAGFFAGSDDGSKDPP
jgi:hypothetical protein